MKGTKWVLLLMMAMVGLLANCKGQTNEVYEFPFSLEKKLLVFKGQLNGVATDFAFDTGAAEGIANTKNVQTNGIERKQSSQRIIDANKAVTYLQSGVTKKLTIGGFTFDDVRASITDMQYLYCMDLYLLGADVIRQLNWEIDFKRMMIRVSKKRFEPSSDMTIIPVRYEYNTPHIKLTLNNISFNDVLVDFGYNGVLTVPNTDDAIKQLLASKKAQQLVTAQWSSSFGATGLSKPALSELLVVDSININGSSYYRLPADFKDNTNFKIGVGFFSGLCNKVLLNNSDKKYYLQLKNAHTFTKGFPVNVLLKDGKLIVSNVMLDAKADVSNFTISETVASVDGKAAQDFNSECDFITWYYTRKTNVQVIEKLDGKKVEVKREAY